MNIQFKLDYDFNLYSTSQKMHLSIVKGLIAGRLMELYKDMKREEDKNPCAILINWSDIDDIFKIGYGGYSSKLREKIKAFLDVDFGNFLNEMAKELSTKE